MNNYVEIIALVEGKTEQIFIQSLLSKYLAEKNIYMTCTQMSKPGQKRGDVRFRRVFKDIETHLKQRKDTYVTLFFDYYGVKEWPNLQEAHQQNSPQEIAKKINEATKEAVNNKLSNYNSQTRFIPYVAIHEFEALFFSNPQILAECLQVKEESILAITEKFKDPEKINNSPSTAPSKRLEKLYPRYGKTSTGISIAKKIGIETMRKKCKVFNDWLIQLENLIGENKLRIE